MKLIMIMASIISLLAIQLEILGLDISPLEKRVLLALSMFIIVIFGFLVVVK